MKKKQSWACARSPSVQPWTRNMEHMKALNEDAYKWLEKMSPNTWVRAYFSEFPKCDILHCTKKTEIIRYIAVYRKKGQNTKAQNQ